MNDTPRIVLLGQAPPEDLRRIISAAQAIPFIVEQIPVLAGSDLQKPPDGYISFLDPTRDILLEAFALLPCASREEIPFYQRIDRAGVPDFFNDLPITGCFCRDFAQNELWSMLRSIRTLHDVASKHGELIGEIVKYRRQKQQLIAIGTSLSLQNDLYQLLDMILTQTRDMLGADAACVYLRERDPATQGFADTLRFKVMQNDSVKLPHEEFSIPINQNTIAGYVTVTGQSLTIDDVYIIDPSVPYRHGKSFDQKFGYRMKSMLTVPLKNTDGQVVGVLQLMNKKTDRQVRLSGPEVVEEHVLPFTASDEDFVLSIASQAAVTIERVQLHEDIQQIFEGFLSSSIAAIDERDRVTSGHSKRVMGYAIAFANAINTEKDNPFPGETFSDNRIRQFKFAALLHDMGKIGVPEALLTKESRISAGEMEALRMRFEYIRLLKSIPSSAAAVPWDSEATIEEDCAFLQKINGSGFLSDPDFARLAGLRDKFFVTPEGERLPLLNKGQWEAFSVRKGNLTESEREEINSHAAKTRRILGKIPWGVNMREIPQIAAHHHEKIDGSGYPDKLKGDQIALESKILAVVDIYEALVAQDRPYKRVMAPDKALDILRAEVAANHLEKNIVDFFIAKGIYKIFSSENK